MALVQWCSFFFFFCTYRILDTLTQFVFALSRGASECYESERFQFTVVFAGRCPGLCPILGVITAVGTEAVDAEEAEAAAKEMLYAVFTGQLLAVTCMVMSQFMKPDMVGERGLRHLIITCLNA